MDKLYKVVGDAEKNVSGKWGFSLEIFRGVREEIKEMVWEEIVWEIEGPPNNSVMSEGSPSGQQFNMKLSLDSHVRGSSWGGIKNYMGIIWF